MKDSSISIGGESSRFAESCGFAESNERGRSGGKIENARKVHTRGYVGSFWALMLMWYVPSLIGLYKPT